jgi:hypothetical protein
MANDRIEIICEVCGNRITLAKHFCEEWYVPDGLVEPLNKFFADHIHWESEMDVHRHFIFQTENGESTSSAAPAQGYLK